MSHDEVKPIIVIDLCDDSDDDSDDDLVLEAAGAPPPVEDFDNEEVVDDAPWFSLGQFLPSVFQDEVVTGDDDRQRLQRPNNIVSVLDFLEPLEGLLQQQGVREWRLPNGSGSQLLKLVKASPDAGEPLLDFLCSNDPREKHVVWISNGMALFVAAAVPFLGTRQEFFDEAHPCRWRMEIVCSGSSRKHEWSLHGFADEGDGPNDFRVVRFVHQVIALSARVRMVELESRAVPGDEHKYLIAAVRDLVSLPRNRRTVKLLFGYNRLSDKMKRTFAYHCSPVVELVVLHDTLGGALFEAMYENQCPKRLHMQYPLDTEFAKALEVTTGIEELKIRITSYREQAIPAFGRNRSLRVLVVQEYYRVTSDTVKTFWRNVMVSATLRSVDTSEISGAGVISGCHMAKVRRPDGRPISEEGKGADPYEYPPDFTDEERRDCAELVARLLRTNPRITNITYHPGAHDAHIMETRVLPILQMNRYINAAVVGMDKMRSLSALVGSPLVRARPNMLYVVVRATSDHLMAVKDGAAAATGVEHPTPVDGGIRFGMSSPGLASSASPAGYDADASDPVVCSYDEPTGLRRHAPDTATTAQGRDAPGGFSGDVYKALTGNSPPDSPVAVSGAQSMRLTGWNNSHDYRYRASQAFGTDEASIIDAGTNIPRTPIGAEASTATTSEAFTVGSPVTASAKEGDLSSIFANEELARIDEMLCTLWDAAEGSFPFGLEEVIEISKYGARAFQVEDSTLSVQSPVTICADVQGNFTIAKNTIMLGRDLLRTKLLFLGSYANGDDLKVFCYLVLLKARFPSSCFLLQGPRERSEVNGRMSCPERTLAKTCKKMFDDDWNVAWNVINGVFERMPFAAIVDKKLFCAYRGVLPHFDSIELRDESTGSAHMIFRPPSLDDDHDNTSGAAMTSTNAGPRHACNVSMYATMVEAFLAKSHLSTVVQVQDSTLSASSPNTKSPFLIALTPSESGKSSQVLVWSASHRFVLQVTNELPDPSGQLCVSITPVDKDEVSRGD